MKNVAVIDGDGLIYHTSRLTIEESIIELDSRIQNIFEKTQSEYYTILLSKGPYFRHSIDPNYKSNRVNIKSNLIWLDTLKAYLKDKYNAYSIKNIEADDLVVYLRNQKYVYYEYLSEISKYPEKSIELKSIIHDVKQSDDTFNKTTKVEDVNFIICSPDKDILKCIPGAHFNYSYKFENNSTIKGWFVETTESEAYVNMWKSVICGDVADGISGLKGKGEAYFSKISAGYNNNLEEIVFHSYISELGTVKGIYEFQKNFRLLYLLQNNEDYIREIGELPNFKFYPTNILLNINEEEDAF